MRIVFCGLGHQIVLLLQYSKLLSPPSLAVSWKMYDINVVASSMVPLCETFREDSIRGVAAN